MAQLQNFHSMRAGVSYEELFFGEVRVADVLKQPNTPEMCPNYFALLEKNFA